MKQFIINQEVIFSTKEKKLFSLKNKKSVIIFSTCARCLEYLLENQGVILSQKELIPVCWKGENSLKIISQATYYQCLTDLRRNFKEVGYEGTLIKTVRGQGVIIDASVNVEVLKNEVQASHLHEQGERLRSFGINSKFKYTNIIFFLMAVMFFFLILICFMAINKQSQNTMTKDYQTIEGYPKCYFFNKENVNNSLIKNFLQKKGFQCENGKNYFVSHFSVAPRLTIFSCSVALPLQCESFTFVGEYL